MSENNTNETEATVTAVEPEATNSGIPNLFVMSRAVAVFLESTSQATEGDLLKFADSVDVNLVGPVEAAGDIAPHRLAFVKALSTFLKAEVVLAKTEGEADVSPDAPVGTAAPAEEIVSTNVKPA